MPAARLLAPIVPPVYPARLKRVRRFPRRAKDAGAELISSPTPDGPGPNWLAKRRPIGAPEISRLQPRSRNLIGTAIAIPLQQKLETISASRTCSLNPVIERLKRAIASMPPHWRQRIITLPLPAPDCDLNRHTSPPEPCLNPLAGWGLFANVCSFSQIFQVGCYGMALSEHS